MQAPGSKKFEGKGSQRGGDKHYRDGDCRKLLPSVQLEPRQGGGNKGRA